MYVSKQKPNSCQEIKPSVLLSYTSKEEFLREYASEKTEGLYLLILSELKEAILEGNIDNFEKLCHLIDYISEVEDVVKLRDYYENNSNPIRNSNLVILASKHNKPKILEYLFESTSKILTNLYIDVRQTTILPHDEDEERHNAFYYAIRSGSIDLLDTLINKWPRDYFALHLDYLDNILSRAYEELKLKNVALPNETEIYVETKLINLRFFSNASGENRSLGDDFNSIRERIKLVLKSISLLKTDNLSTDEVDEKFLFVVKSIAKNIQILKQQLKSTYDIIPWEETEFLLVMFISAHIKRTEIHLYYNAILSKSKILRYMEYFEKKLEGVNDNIKRFDNSQLSNLPAQLKREEVVAEIISSYPQFAEFYKDFQEIRDLQSMKRISDQINLIISVDPQEIEGRLAITRGLQVIGEHLKNTLECPKLSHMASELFLLSLQEKSRKIVVDLRDAPSYTDSIWKRNEICENEDVDFFINLQKDIQGVGDVITGILDQNKIKIDRILLEKILKSDNCDEISRAVEDLRTVKISKMAKGNFENIERAKVSSIFNMGYFSSFHNCYEKQLHREMVRFLEIFRIGIDFSSNNNSLNVLKNLNNCLGKKQTNDNLIIAKMRLLAEKILLNIDQHNIKPHNYSEITKLLMKLFQNGGSVSNGKVDEVNRSICKLLLLTKFDTDDIKWMKEFIDVLNEKVLLVSINTQASNVTEEDYENQLSLKLDVLKNFLSNNSLRDQITTEKLISYKTDKRLQAVLEILVLDILSILSSLKHCCENDLLFLDVYTPLLTGRCLCNYLANDNALVDVLPSDPSLAVLLNAIKITEQNYTSEIRNKKERKLVSFDFVDLSERDKDGLATITNQKKMFVALKEGDLEIVKDCLKNGTDVNARSINLWTTLHVAAKDSTLEVVKFILDRNVIVNVKDINGQSPLHIAAANGRKGIVEFFVTEVGLQVDDLNKNDQTALHLAAQNGHIDTVEVLLKNFANFTLQDCNGFTALHYAIRCNHIQVAKILMEKDVHNFDINDTISGFTPLHEAAENAYLELVQFLLQNKANVNARNDESWTPLHVAIKHGHMEVVNALIVNGADVNVTILDGITPLYVAIKFGHENITNILLERAANVEAIGRNLLYLAIEGNHVKIVATLLNYGLDINYNYNTYNDTPLYFAVKFGNKEVAELLIKNGAQIQGIQGRYFAIGLTPLHVAALEGYKDVVDLLIKHNAVVNAKDKKLGSTPLHSAATNGSKDIIDLLLKSGAEINAKANDGETPLHVAAAKGHGDAVAFLIQNNAEVNAKNNYDCTPLHFAVVNGHKDVVNYLIKNKAEVDVRAYNEITLQLGGGYVLQNNLKLDLQLKYTSILYYTKHVTPLLLAIQTSQKEIVEVLIDNGAKVNVPNDNQPLLQAVAIGYTDIIEILLKNKAAVNQILVEDEEYKFCTPLHIAAQGGNKKVVTALIANGAIIDCFDNNNKTPLHFAVRDYYANVDVVKMLIARGANMNVKDNCQNTPLQDAISRSNVSVVNALLDNKENINFYDKDNNMEILKLAVFQGELQVIKLLQCNKVDIVNLKYPDDMTLLHFASQVCNLELVKYLVDEGCDINAREASGLKPIHMAKQETRDKIVQFFLSKGISVNDPGAENQTLLHYAVRNGGLKYVKYLIDQNADLNAKDIYGITPTHLATKCGRIDILELLLNSGAYYNSVNELYEKPLDIANNRNKCFQNNERLIDLLTKTETLFNAVQQNNSSEVEKCIKAGASVNAKNTNGESPLHYAARKGFYEVANILLQNQANPNVIGNDGFTPLHYAAKFTHLKCVKTLLANYAVYDAIADGGKTPADFTVDVRITRLLTLVRKSFEYIEIGNSQLISDINKIKDLDTIRAVMCARNRKNETLVVAAMHSTNFAEIEQLKNISQDGVSANIKEASVLLSRDNFQKALKILKSALERRIKILGPDNPATLDIQIHIAQVLYKQGCYQEALNILREIVGKQMEIRNNFYLKDLYKTITILHLVLLSVKGIENEDFFVDYEVIYQFQNKELGPNHLDTLYTQLVKALVLHREEKYQEALRMNTAVFDKINKISDANHPIALRAQDNIAMVLANQGKLEEALKICNEVFEKKKSVYGINHSETLTTLSNIGVVLFYQQKFHVALKCHHEVLGFRKIVLGPNHPDTLITQYNIANVLFAQGKWILAYKVYTKDCDRIGTILAKSHPTVTDISQKINKIHQDGRLLGGDMKHVIENLQVDINIAIKNGDVRSVERYLKYGANAKDGDKDGETPLYCAVSNGHLHIVDILLADGADATQIRKPQDTSRCTSSSVGYPTAPPAHETLLHTAISKGHNEIAELLIQNVSAKKLNDFINYKNTVDGNTALHIASSNGNLLLTESLLKRGAIYDVKNKAGKSPLDLSTEQNINNVLKLVEELFEDAKNCNIEIFIKLRALNPDEFQAVTNACNSQGKTLLKVSTAAANKYINFLSKLTEVIKEADESLQDEMEWSEA